MTEEFKENIDTTFFMFNDVLKKLKLKPGITSFASIGKIKREISIPMNLY